MPNVSVWAQTSTGPMYISAIKEELLSYHSTLAAYVTYHTIGNKTLLVHIDHPFGLSAIISHMKKHGTMTDPFFAPIVENASLVEAIHIHDAAIKLQLNAPQPHMEASILERITNNKITAGELMAVNKYFRHDSPVACAALARLLRGDWSVEYSDEEVKGFKLAIGVSEGLRVAIGEKVEAEIGRREGGEGVVEMEDDGMEVEEMPEGEGDEALTFGESMELAFRQKS